MNKIEPLGNRVLIKETTVTETPGGLFIPGNVNERFRKGKVLAVGIGEVCGTNDNLVVLKKISVKPGDIICYDNNRAIDVGNGNLLVDEHDLQCKYVEEKAADTN